MAIILIKPIGLTKVYPDQCHAYAYRLIKSMWMKTQKKLFVEENKLYTSVEFIT